MATKKTRFSTSRSRATEDRASIDAVLDALATKTPDDLTSEDYEGLSDLSRPAAERLAERWSEIPLPLRLELVQLMVSMRESEIEHHFDRALVVALGDDISDVKLAAFEGLTDTTLPSLLDYLLEQLPDEPDAAVRASGVEVMGQFALQAELNKLDESTVDRLRNVLLSLAEDDETATVRLRAVESAAFLAGDPEVIDAIEDLWESGHHEAQVSALRAMGRQSDPRWSDLVMAQFQSDEPEIRFEAARAIGTLGSQRVVPRILDLVDDEDVEVQMAAIASLGMIGGPDALRALRNLEQSDSVAIADAASAALDEAMLLDNPARPPSSLWQQET